MDNSESVDFDFFETPRDDVRSPKGKQLAGKPPSAHKHDRKAGKNETIYSDDSLSTDSDSELQVIKPSSEKSRHNDSPERTPTKNEKSRKYRSDSESSSAYSNSDFSSDNSDDDDRTPTKKEKIRVNIPKVQAWSLDAGDVEQETERNSKTNGEKSPQENRKEYDQRKDRKSSHRRRKSISSNSSDSDSSEERYRRKSDSKSDQVKSAKNRNRRQETRKTLKSNSSYSNNSDITDVSPLESPEASPRDKRKSNHKQHKGDSKYDVQYKDKFSPAKDVDIKLDSDKIDLSILMKCMADIDAEKQQRLKTNSRRVMFAPPNERSKQNYSFTMDRAKMIEKENQRLLKQIMNHIGTGKPKPSASATRTPKKAVQPVMNSRLTPSALNRQREQRRIESENMHILHRLQTIRPTPGMSKTEQIHEFEKTSSYGVPGKTMIVSGGGTARYHTLRQQEMHSSLGIPQRSRPGSAKSNASLPGKRSRPSSAKSDVSMRSNASSMRSTASKRSTMSMRSNASIRSRKMSDGKNDYRPPWDDRFTVT